MKNWFIESIIYLLINLLMHNQLLLVNCFFCNLTESLDKDGKIEKWKMKKNVDVK